MTLVLIAFLQSLPLKPRKEGRRPGGKEEREGTEHTVINIPGEDEKHSRKNKQVNS